MAFPWELNLNGAYRDKKWDLPDELARGRPSCTVPESDDQIPRSIESKTTNACSNGSDVTPS
jgi:hypothetical protein